MKVLLDNCLPRPFEKLLPGHEVIHCNRLGWRRLGNGQLLTAAQEAGFPVMLTVDKSIETQQNMARRSIMVIYLRAPSNKLDVLKVMTPQVLLELERIRPGVVVTIDHPDWRD